MKKLLPIGILAIVLTSCETLLNNEAHRIASQNSEILGWVNVLFWAILYVVIALIREVVFKKETTFEWSVKFGAFCVFTTILVACWASIDIVPKA
jgi:hypothetical protein